MGARAAQLVGPLAVGPTGTCWIARGTASGARARSVASVPGSTGGTSARGRTLHVAVQAREHRTGYS
jgi:hypothetical protein